MNPKTTSNLVKSDCLFVFYGVGISGDGGSASIVQVAGTIFTVIPLAVVAYPPTS